MTAVCSTGVGLKQIFRALPPLEMVWFMLASPAHLGDDVSSNHLSSLARRCRMESKHCSLVAASPCAGTAVALLQTARTSPEFCLCFPESSGLTAPGIPSPHIVCLLTPGVLSGEVSRHCINLSRLGFNPHLYLLLRLTQRCGRPLSSCCCTAACSILSRIHCPCVWPVSAVSQRAQGCRSAWFSKRAERGNKSKCVKKLSFSCL